LYASLLLHAKERLSGANELHQAKEKLLYAKKTAVSEGKIVRWK
jgi:hypothetical protein